MKKVEIYSTETCHFCHLAKEFFDTHNVAYTDYNVGKDQAKLIEMRDRSGQMGVPVIVVDDKDIVIGFDKDRLVELIGISA